MTDSIASRLRSIPTDMLEATAFLSRLPVHRLIDLPERPDFDRIAYAFPLAGFLIALPAALVLALLLALGLPPIAVAAITVTVQIITTGALHEDGLADTADGFWGGATKERKLAIMRDSATGSYGTLALILSVLLRTVLLAAILSSVSTVAAIIMLLVVASLSRGAMLSPWHALPAAREDSEEKPGLSRHYGGPTTETLPASSLCALPALTLLTFTFGIATALVTLAIGLVAIIVAVRLAERHIGGHTGDTLGATQQVVEWGLYLGLAASI